MTTPSPENPLLADPYDYAHCQITATITWLPSDDHPQGREVVLAVRNHEDPPLMRVYRATQLEGLLEDTLEELLAELRRQLPARQLSKMRQEAETQPVKKASGTKPEASPNEKPQLSLF